MEEATESGANDDEVYVEKERLKGRNSEIWKLHLEGWTQERIGAKFEITQARVSQILQQIRASIPKATRQELINTEVERLDWVTSLCAELMQGTYLLTNGGRIVHEITEYALDDEGNPRIDDFGNPVPAQLRKLHDPGPVLQAADRFLAASKERRRLLGLDSPTKAEHSGPDGGPIAVDMAELSPEEIQRRARTIFEEVNRAYEDHDEADDE